MSSTLLEIFSQEELPALLIMLLEAVALVVAIGPVAVNLHGDPAVVVEAVVLDMAV